MTIGPCLCGDPYCGSCGDPGAAAFDAFMETLEQAIEGFSEFECSVFIKAGMDAVTEGRKWTTLTMRTNDPKLSWLEHQLDLSEISHRRNGETFHAPIMEVQKMHFDAAWKILMLTIFQEDDDPRWTEDML